MFSQYSRILEDMKQLQALQILRQWDNKGRYVYLRRDLRKLFREPAQTFNATLRRLVASGILCNAARGVYVYTLSRSSGEGTLDLIARNLRRGELTYESYESVLSDLGIISQIMPDRRTYATTGREGEYCTNYGVIDFTHINVSPMKILRRVHEEGGRNVPIASPGLAYENLKSARRNLDLVNMEELSDAEH